MFLSLLSSAGIPKLRRIAKDKLKFKGKGHEFSDISRMLNLYQLWLDDLYPKAKFKDGLMMVEKLGHTKRMQVSRRAWIDESKNIRRREDEDVEMRLGDVEGQAQEDNDEIFPIPKEPVHGQEQSTGGADAPDEDELDALMGEEPGATVPIRAVDNGPPKPHAPFQDDDEPDEDELDALLNEDRQPTAQPKQQATKQKGPFEDDEDDQDELDALLAEEPHATGNKGGVAGDSSNTQHSTNNGQEADFADDEEAMADMGW
jgi:replication fork protection complex subunit Csm3/Swi3